MKKAVVLSILLIGVGMTIGVFLVSSISPNSLQNLFANENVEIGAAEAPVTVDPMAHAVNKAMQDASDAVLPTVVYISVDAKISSDDGNRGMEDFFRFWGMPEGERRSRGSGSGVIISSDGYIVTNNHVVENATSNGIKVKTVDKKQYQGKLIGRDPLTDLAIIKIEAENLPVAHFGNIENVNVGEMVLAVGNPLGLNYTVTSGIVSAIGRGSIGSFRRGGYSVEHYIQTDAAINPGNSGGGLFDLSGSLIGINTAIATETGTFMGYGFAIPVDLVKAVVEDLVDDGEIDRGYIGVVIDEVDEVLARGLGLDEVGGVLIQNVNDGSAGEKAGLRSQDVILTVNGHQVNSPSELQTRVAFYRAGDKIELDIWRDGKKIKKSVILQPREEEEDISFKGESDENEKDEELTDTEPITFDELGFTVEPISKEVKEEFNIESGVVVTNVKRYSPAADRGLFPRGIIHRVDKETVNSPKELKKILEDKSIGDVVLLHVKYADRDQIVALEMPEM